MKKLFTFYLLFIVATSFVLSSCHHNMSVTKRRYNKGYYVHHNANKHHDVAVNNTEKVKAPKAEKPMLVAPKTEAVAVAAEEKAATEAPAKAVTASNTAKKEKRAIAKPVIKNNTITYKTQLSDLSAKRSFKAINNQIISQKAAAEDGLSLFWIVILVLLILWALGLIGGLGGVVYILLIVALILLILWLLRIV